MATYKNIAAGLRGITMKDGSTVYVEPGASAEVEGGTVAKVHPDLKGHPLDHDADGRKGGSKPSEPPALTGKNKPELLAIAKAEGVQVEDGATNPDIVSAIELHREEAAKG